MLFDALFKHRNRTSCDQKKSCIKSLTNSTANATNARVFIMLLVVWIFSALPCCAPDEDADKADVSMKRPLWRAKWEQEHPWKPSRMAKKRAWRRKQAAKHAPEPQLPGLGRPKTYSERLVDRLVAAPATLVLVHIPKCGSTFCLSMSRAQCPWAFATSQLLDPSQDNSNTSSVSPHHLTSSNSSRSMPTPSFCSAFDEVYLSQGCARMRSLADLALARAETMLPKYKNGIANQSQHHSRIDEKPPEVCEAATLKDHGPLTDDLLAALLPPEHNQVMSDNVLDTRPPEITLVGSNRPHIRASALTRLATRRLVIILRQPLARVVSMFADQRHLVGMDDYSAAAMTSAMANRSEDACRHVRKSRKLDCSICVETEAFRVYLHHPAASGCVTKTLTGQWCSAAIVPTLAEARVALHRLRGFYFVGIFEQWAATVTAFHTKIASERRSSAGSRLTSSSLPASSLPASSPYSASKPCPVELAPTRERPKGAEAMTQALTQTAEDVGYSDPWDGALYTEGLVIFERYHSGLPGIHHHRHRQNHSSTFS